MRSQTEPHLHCLVYTSAALASADNSIYENIAHISKTHNDSANITGLLLVHNGLIMQILEGRKQDVEDLYARIENDTRHRNPQVLLRRSIETRDFPHWSMGYQCSVKRDVDQSIFKLSQISLAQAIPKSISSASRGLLSSFSLSSGLQRI